MILKETNVWTTHTYKTDEGEVKIHWKNGVFDHCDFPFKGKYTPAQWEILRQIAVIINGE